MKKTVYLTLVFLLFMNISIWASVAIVNHGSYENDDVKFTITYNWGNSTPTPERAAVHFADVRFEIESKKGFNIYNKTYFIFEGRDYIFNSDEIRNHFYKEGYREFDNKDLKNGTVIKLVYELRKKGSEKYIQTRKVEKKFKLLLSENQSKSENIIKIVELKK
ncbi:MAG TPA: hypothetical protein PK906_10845 [Spirochaetota bacterium]|nr:hypothetical protein [Spirochaetota bacterium]